MPIPHPQPGLSAELWIDTSREGILARVGHDLRLGFSNVDLKVDASGNQIDVRVDLRSCFVAGVREHGVVRSDRLSRDDCEKILHAIATEVLDTARFPFATYLGKVDEKTADGFFIQGSLSLHGHTRPLAITVKQTGQSYEGYACVTGSAHAIVPYRALAGALKVRDRVEIVVAVRGQADGLPPTHGG